jgi:hypothetical protein
MISLCPVRFCEFELIALFALISLIFHPEENIFFTVFEFEFESITLHPFELS